MILSDTYHVRLRFPQFTSVNLHFPRTKIIKKLFLSPIYHNASQRAKYEGGNFCSLARKKLSILGNRGFRSHDDFTKRQEYPCVRRLALLVYVLSCLEKEAKQHYKYHIISTVLALYVWSDSFNMAEIMACAELHNEAPLLCLKSPISPRVSISAVITAGDLSGPLRLSYEGLPEVFGNKARNITIYF